MCSDALDKLSKCGTPHAFPDALKNSWGEHCYVSEFLTLHVSASSKYHPDNDKECVLFSPAI